MAWHKNPRLNTDGLIHYLDPANNLSYPGTGTDWKDLINISNSGSMLGPVFSSNNQGVLTFDSSSTDYVAVDSNLFTDSFLQSDWTISFWVNWSSLSTINGSPFPDRTLLQHGTNTGNQGLHLTQRNTRIHFGLYGDDVQGSLTLQTNTWYNVVFVLKNSATFNQKIFINGVLDAERTPSGSYAGTGGNARIGGVVLGFGHYFDGDMSACAAYNRLLTEQEILQNYNALRGRYGK